MKITEQLDAALAEVTQAEAALELVLGDLQGGPRAEKVSVSEVVAQAFIRLRTARVTLSKLREDLARESAPDA